MPDFKDLEDEVVGALQGNLGSNRIPINIKLGLAHWTGLINFRMENEGPGGSRGHGTITTARGSGATSGSSNEQRAKTTVSGELSAGGHEGGAGAKVAVSHESWETNKTERGASKERKAEQGQELDRQGFVANLVADIELKCDWQVYDSEFWDMPWESAFKKRHLAPMHTSVACGVIGFWKNIGLYGGT